MNISDGKHPDTDKGGGLTQEIFDNYHTKLYPGITEYREGYVLKSAKKNGYIHMGLGARIYTDDPTSHIRTLNNSTCQFWSILTLIAINELNHRTREAELDGDILVNATIYDSIYGYVKNDSKTIKWLNDNLVPIMEKDFVEGQLVGNSADLCIGVNWANVEDSELSHGATLEEIEEVLTKIKERK